MVQTIDVTDLVTLYSGAFAGLAAELDRKGMIDGRALAGSIATSGTPLSPMGEDLREQLVRSIVHAVEVREARARGPRPVT